MWLSTRNSNIWLVIFTRILTPHKIANFWFVLQASSSCDGSVRIWTIKDQKMAKEWSAVTVPSNSFKSAESLCHLSWEPLTGRLFAVPFGAEVRVFQRSSWNVMMTLSNQTTVRSLKSITHERPCASSTTYMHISCTCYIMSILNGSRDVQNEIHVSWCLFHGRHSWRTKEEQR